MKTVKVIYPGPAVTGEARRGPCFYSRLGIQLSPPAIEGEPIEVLEKHYEDLLRLGVIEDVPAVRSRKQAAARDEAEKLRRKAAAAASAAEKAGEKKDPRSKDRAPQEPASAGQEG